MGDQNYLVPASIDLTQYRSAVVWCRRFSVGLAVAPLNV
ncbi:MAG: DM13 domain-containing protein [Actinobacteria bacterium]|nr:DM13 domain-containing protein [Actinomycetota bacterium]